MVCQGRYINQYWRTQFCQETLWRPSSTINIIPSKLTRRHCASKVAEIFYLTGKVSPITASMKLDLQELVHCKLDWDDTIPDDLHPTLESNFKIMKDTGTLRFKHAIIPEDAVDLNINTLDFGDASQSMVCVCIYARLTSVNLYFLVQEWYHRVYLNQEQSCMLL